MVPSTSISRPLVDVNNYWVVGELLYGHALVNSFPDLDRTDHLVMIGANPVVSHGSMMTVGRVRETLLEIPRRGGRVTVVDPRRSETARLFEHVPIRPDADAWLLAGMLRVIFDEELQDNEALARQTTGADFLRRLVAGVDLDRVEHETRISIDKIAQLARDVANAPSAAVYGRCGASLGARSTLVKYLIDAVNFVTGNLDREGGMIFGYPMINLEKLLYRFGLTGYDRWRTRVDDFPEVIGTSPLATLAREITTPGKGQLRALISACSNVANTGPACEEIDAALPQLDLFVSLDLYRTETNRHADFILPSAHALERDNFPIFTQGHSYVPVAKWSEAVVHARGEAKDDSWSLDQICRRTRLVPSPLKVGRLLGRVGIRPKPATMVDLLLRTGKHGDWFGLRRGGLSRRKLLASGPLKLADRCPTGTLQKHVFHKDGKVHLEHEIIESEFQRMLDSPAPEVGELRLINQRQLRGQNSSLNNIPKLMVGDRSQRLSVNPQDAEAVEVLDGETVELTSQYGTGTITVPVSTTDDVAPGAAALPPGFGHNGGWQVANAAGGARYNVLTPSHRENVDLPSGNAKLNGIKVTMRPVRNDSRSRSLGQIDA
ncbi:molybdopterin-dependent oxidoreductase [Haloechinothrix aidingensis]|uniref:molybdopterin-dependent oxidoreductase n=1 Tax=Haloechinothrix aidingensis TaxID=2752311 RepID=UPI0024840223|nr:molybdopterin-dependent oxidoreductase [Haloechinothrix aidingensis]